MFSGYPTISGSVSLGGLFYYVKKGTSILLQANSNTKPMSERVTISGSPIFTGSPTFSGNPTLSGNPAITGDASISGNPTVSGNSVFTGGASFLGDVDFQGNVTFNGSGLSTEVLLTTVPSTTEGAMWIVN